VLRTGIRYLIRFRIPFRIRYFIRLRMQIRFLIWTWFGIRIRFWNRMRT
jgi:hypothetical protein